jgi:hypothetical protein
VTLQAVFLEWMDQLRKRITTNGEYTEQGQINVIKEWSFILPILRCSCPGRTPCSFKWMICPKHGTMSVHCVTSLTMRIEDTFMSVNFPPLFLFSRPQWFNTHLSKANQLFQISFLTFLGSFQRSSINSLILSIT